MTSSFENSVSSRLKTPYARVVFVDIAQGWLPAGNDSGIIFIHATWSANSYVSLVNLDAAISTSQDPKQITVWVVDIDQMTEEFLSFMGQPANGNGEVLLIKQGKLTVFLPAVVSGKDQLIVDFIRDSAP